LRDFQREVRGAGAAFAVLEVDADVVDAGRHLRRHVDPAGLGDGGQRSVRSTAGFFR
jgi:hypothetical protein